MMSPIHLVVALRCEAAPLIERHGLRPLARETGQRRIYEGAGLRLIVSGVGRAAAAAAVDELAARGGPAAYWIDLGVAGHRTRPLGQVLLAHVVHERATGRIFELHPPRSPCPCCELETTDDVVVDYPTTDRAVDMEASGFVAAAQRLAAPGSVHCLKVISDNADHPASSAGSAASPARPAAARISALIGGALATLDLLCAALRRQERAS